jgi:alpha-N-arabinofuranosidase
LRQSTYYPYLWALELARGEVLDLAVESPTYQVAGKGAVPYVDASCTLDRQGNSTSLFLLNRDLEKAREVEVVWRDAAPRAVASARVLTGNDLKAVNTFEAPTKVAPRELAPPRPGSRMTIELPPRSYAALEFTL